jgi:ABC-2 type transport system permease protein
MTKGAMTQYTGTGALVRLALRRDRVMIPVWLAALVLSAYSGAAAVVKLYPAGPDLVKASEQFNQVSAVVALYGRIYDPANPGGLALVKLGGLGSVFVALMSILLVVRHTRAEEETGRQELIGATVVGRRAPLTAALIVAIGTNLVLAALTAVVLIGGGLDPNGSFAFGAAWAGVGIVFAGVAAITAQLTSTGRAATGLAGIVLGVVYVLRAIGDTAGPNGPTWASWISPVGWGQQFHWYAHERWWVGLLMLALTAVLIPVAYALVARRDIAAGLLPDRPGPAAAGRSLRSALALAWRLQRGTLYAWAAACVVLSLVLGNLATNLSGFLDNPQAQEFIAKLGGEKALADAYLSATMSFVAVAISAYGIQAASRLRGEESALRAEPLLAAGTTRARWVFSHLLVALGGTAALLGITGVVAGLTYGAKAGDLGRAGGVIAGAVGQLPATWVLTGITMAAFGLVPRIAAVGWSALGVFVLLGVVGPLIPLDQPVMDISPFTHSPKLPGGVFSATPVVALTGVAVLLVAAGLYGFRRRDVPVT